MVSGDNTPRAVKIALVQMRAEKGDIAGNLATIAACLGEAAERGVEIICFPEMSVTGYVDPTRMRDAALALDDDAIAAVVELTSRLPATVIAGLVERNPGGKPFITQMVARNGQILGVYRKLTIIDDEAEWFTPGASSPPIFDHDGLPFSVAICADIESPAIYRDCAARGAKVVFHAAAPGLYGEQETRDWQAGFDWWRDECMTKLAGYARDNRVFVAVSTQAGRTIDEDFPGGGYLFGPDGVCLAATADWSEGVLYAEVPR